MLQGTYLTTEPPKISIGRSRPIHTLVGGLGLHISLSVNKYLALTKRRIEIHASSVCALALLSVRRERDSDVWAGARTH